MPSVFTLQGPTFGMPNITALNDNSYGQQFIRRIGPPIAGPLGFGVPAFGTLVLMGASAAAGIFGYKWWMKRKRRR